MENTPLQETLSTEREPISEECREDLLQYLRESSDTALSQEIRLPTPEEIEIAEGLFSLELPRSDAAPNRHYTFSDSNFNSDVLLREKVLIKYNLKNCQIRRHDIALNRENSVLPIKVINLVEVKTAEDGSNKYTNIDNGILFVGKIKFEGNDTKYIELTEEDMMFARSVIEKNKN